MTLTRASIRDKLNLLLLVPLLATVLLALPFVASRLDEARAASVAAEAATNARQVADLLYALQQERLASVDHLSTSVGHLHVRMLQHYSAVDDAVADLRTSLGEELSPRLRDALRELSRLGSIRQKVLSGKVQPRDVFNDYRDVTDGLLGGLGLDVRTAGSAPASRQLEALDALLRANEQSSRAGAALVLAAEDAEVGWRLLVEANALLRLHSDQFVRVAERRHAELMRVVDTGRSTAQLRQLTEQVRIANRTLDATYVARARSVAEAQGVLRQLLLVRAARDVQGAASSKADAAQIAAWAVSVGTLLLFGLVVALGVMVSRSIAGPVRHLTRAAGAVAELASTELARVSDSERIDDRPPRLAAIAVDSQDEVGDLATAFNRVQATAALLLERQVHTRRNVGLMFASVARRTQNLVGGQLALIDQLERNEQDPKLLSELYRLDHLSMRLRRSAESLLVVSGVRDETRLAVPAQLATVLRSALAEIEDFQRVRLVSICDVTVAPGLVADLSLLLAELLENATSFSPPTVVVDVTAERVAGGCRITIADHGIGMSAAQIAEENRRFVQRERLDIAPTTVLGLFVVGRIARRHRLDVTLQPTPGGGITAVVAVPRDQLTAESSQAGDPAALSGGTPDADTGRLVGAQVRGPVATLPPAVAPVDSSRDNFAWFVQDHPARQAAVGAAPPPVAPSPPVAPTPHPRPLEQ
ncbi:MAG: nitrate- and nitrite sensing domain-containing protein, partial [Micromonosporaceae bacterium]